MRGRQNFDLIKIDRLKFRLVKSLLRLAWDIFQEVASVFQIINPWPDCCFRGICENNKKKIIEKRELVVLLIN